MKKYKYVLIAIIIGTQMVPISAAASHGYVSIEGVTPFSQDQGSEFTAIPRRKSNKSEITIGKFTYFWSKSGGGALSFELEPSGLID